ncbi:MAG: adenylate/guanylate cyclase domain-containing protein [Planctomycetes bacterium]|nr:adenylate/guanylate cyclase domain-containing protein [Planctomycetota bacterium]
MRSRTVVAVFTDLVGSTQLKSSMGDTRAGELIRQHHDLVQKLAGETRGRIIKSLGDGFMLSFEAPTDALNFGLFLQFAHATVRSDLPKVRIGMNLGEVTEDEDTGDIHGMAVDVASRVQSLSEPGQLLLTSTVHEAVRARLPGLNLPLPACVLEHGRYRFAGLQYPLAIVEAGFEQYSPLRAPSSKDKAWRDAPEGPLPETVFETAGMPAVVFRNLASNSRPGAGELLVLAKEDEKAGELGLATRLLKDGLDSLRQGEGVIKCLVVPVNETAPTLDHMLAASMAKRLIAGRALPNSMSRFARYASIVREGLRPADHPVEHSIEAIYLAMLLSGEQNLALPKIGSEFLAKWSKMESAILDAANRDVDPFKTAFLANDADFSRERAFLLRDRDVYRTDVREGDRFMVSIPGGPRHASALVLHEPRSILWKFWARSDAQSPTKDSYLVLGVNVGMGRWVFSTDPVHRVSLHGLWQRLQDAEARLDLALSKRDPWFDGALFNHTLISTPRAGTRLNNETVMRIFTEWCQGKRVA